MKHVMIMILISMSCITMSAKDSLAGYWKTNRNNTVVKIESQDDVFTGKIISTEDNENRIGSLIIKDVKLNNGEWQGKIYAPKRNEWYNAKFNVLDDKLTIIITVGFFVRTLEWSKTEVE